MRIQEIQQEIQREEGQIYQYELNILNNIIVDGFDEDWSDYNIALNSNYIDTKINFLTNSFLDILGIANPLLEEKYKNNQIKSINELEYETKKNLDKQLTPKIKRKFSYSIPV